MRKIDRLFGVVLLVCLAVLGLADVFLFQMQVPEKNGQYRVSLNRIEKEIKAFEQKEGRPAESLEELLAFAGEKEYPYITKCTVLPQKEESAREAGSQKQKDFWKNESEEYRVLASEQAYYKVYYVSEEGEKRVWFLWTNGIGMVFFSLMAGLLFYVRQKILLPFSDLNQIPYELAKGNLTVPLKEQKGRYFGKFMWGMDLLRENLEEQKARELELQREKKLLLLSLSHDIKTPLSAIHLYAQALCRNLYQEEEKKREIAENMKKKAEEIEAYISEIVKASNEDFLDFQVDNTEIYVKDVLEQIRIYYAEKMALNQIEFSLEPYSNCLVWGDLDRMVEVIQNVVENAIKYGDGKVIRISPKREEEEYVISICNTGCGLPEKELPHLFDSFFRGSNVGKNNGSGLGLYICRQLIHRMEGEITAAVRAEKEASWMEIRVILHLA